MAFSIDLAFVHPSKIKNFLMQIDHNSLGVRFTLANRKIIPINRCTLFNSNSETLDRLFGECPSLTPLKILPDLQLWLPFSFSNDTLLENLSKLRKQKSNLTNFIFLIWTIWKETNEIIFCRSALNIHRILQ